MKHADAFFCSSHLHKFIFTMDRTNKRTLSLWKVASDTLFTRSNIMKNFTFGKKVFKSLTLNDSMHIHDSNQKCRAWGIKTQKRREKKNQMKITKSQEHWVWTQPSKDFLISWATFQSCFKHTYIQTYRLQTHTIDTIGLCLALFFHSTCIRFFFFAWQMARYGLFLGSFK